MAERKTVNKYYPPDWRPEHGSLNTYLGQHPLRERARKLDQGILVIRFEMPFNIWCGGCGRHIARGVRYNAEKKKIGNYFSTAIYSFKMRCHLCPNYIVINTDPEHQDYVVVEGGKRKSEIWDPKDSETIALIDDEKSKRLIDDPLFKLEHQSEDKKVLKKAVPALEALQDLKKEDWDRDFDSSKKLKKIFREKRKIIEKEEEESDRIKKKASLDIPILKSTIEDEIKILQTDFKSKNVKPKEDLIKRKLKVKATSIFGENQKELDKKIKLLTKMKTCDIKLSPSFQSGTNEINFKVKVTKAKEEKVSDLKDTIEKNNNDQEEIKSLVDY